MLSTSSLRSVWERISGSIGGRDPARAGTAEGDGPRGRRGEEAPRVLATALGEPEADLIRQRLANAGISSTSRRVTGGVELGDAGARYIYVAARDFERARGILGGPA